MRTVLTLVCLAVAATAAPNAREVVVRGNRDLSDLLARATSEAWRDGQRARPVALVVDVTEHTRECSAEIEAAVESLADRIRRLDGSWRIGALGARLSAPVKHPSALSVMVPKVLAADTEEVNTVAALERTLATFRDTGGVVVYLADWHFEDEHGLEGFVSGLKARRQTFSVIGSEAAFERGWNDGFPVFGIFPGEYAKDVGRKPFGPVDPKAPWHGGDTAYPHVPWSFGNLPWRTQFPAPVPGRMRFYPLPSGYGPYPLMRTAAETGGKYYLYSFDPAGRVDVTYDFGRVNLFPPDLRPRREILADARRLALPRAILKAWHLLSEPASGVVDLTPPVTRGGAPAELAKVEGLGTLMFHWSTKSDHERFLDQADALLASLDTAIGYLRRALDAPATSSPVESRYRADADLLCHTLAVLRFEVAEAVAAAREIPADAWDGEQELIPGIAKEDWILPGRDPEELRYGRGKPIDEKAGDRIAEARLDHLRRYGGTAFGETVARNPVVVWRYLPAPNLLSGANGDLGKTPSESIGDPRPTPDPRPLRPGGSGGGGSGTGR